MNKKSLIIAILLVFVVILSSASVFAEDVTNDTTLQQNDDISDIIQENATTSQKTETVKTGSNSSVIQDQINSLSDGDTLNFESGEYDNISIYVNKSITINGNGAVLKGYDTPTELNTPTKIRTSASNGGYAITNFAILYIINTDGVTLNGLTFIGGANSGSEILSALVYAKNVTNLNINNNTFDGACTGVYLNLCANGVISNNTVQNQSSTGILNFASKETVIEKNTVINAANHGIDVRHGTGPSVKVINNTVIGSKEGIYLMHSAKHIAAYNTLINCTISSITCYGSKNIRIYNNTLKYSRIGVLLANGYSNITIGENNYQLYRLPMPPIFTYYVAEAKADYQSAEGVMGTYTDLSCSNTTYTTYSEVPKVTERVIDYNTLLTPTGNTVDVPDGATSAKIQAILDGLSDGDAIRFAQNGVYYNISIYTTKNIKIIGNNATLYGLEKANMSDMPAEIQNLGVIYLAVLYSANNTNVSISDLNIVSRYPDHGILLGTTPTSNYKTAGIYAIKSENIVITNCKVDGASFGIMLHFIAGKGGCANAIVTNNYITNQYTYGILNFGSKASYIANNTIINARWHGIDVRHQMGPNVVVYNNTIIGSSEGIYLMHSHGHKVYNNTIINCSVSSITAYGSVSTNVNNIYIFNNNLTGSRIGILVGGGNQNVTIGPNTYVLDAQKSGDKPGFGLYLVQSENLYSDAADVAGTYNDQQEMVLDTDDSTIGYKKGAYEIKVTDENGNPLANRTGTVTINNVKYDIKTDENGKASIALSLTTGTYDCEVEMLSDYYYSSVYKLSTITVKDDRPTTAITAAAKTTYLKTIKSGYKYSITLKDASGKVLANKAVSVTFNGKTYKATTNSKGVATVTLKAAKIGSYKATVKFAADNTYKATTKTATIKVTREASKITASKKTFKVKTKTKKYTITLKSKSGKAISKVKVYLKVKGKTYKATTNSKGKATFKITKLTKKGKYTAKITFKTSTYYNKATKSVKITVKK